MYGVDHLFFDQQPRLLSGDHLDHLDHHLTTSSSNAAAVTAASVLNGACFDMCSSGYDEQTTSSYDADGGQSSDSDCSSYDGYASDQENSDCTGKE